MDRQGNPFHRWRWWQVSIKAPEEWYPSLFSLQASGVACSPRTIEGPAEDALGVDRLV